MKAEQMANLATVHQNDIKSSQEVVASIDDILIEILVRLPIKPLIRFKSVSKHWRSLISSREFRLRHNIIPNPACGIFFRTRNHDWLYQYYYIPFYPDNPVPFTPLDFTTSPSSTIIFKSCNGLMLWKDKIYVHGAEDYSFHVFNPTTQSYAALPDVPTGSKLGAALAFDPVRSPHYKVVLIMYGDYHWKLPRHAYRVKVYSSESGDWRECGQTIGAERIEFGSGVYWNGSIHWISSNIWSRDDRGSSLRLNVETLVLDEMPTPPLVRRQGYGSNYYFGESCGHLHFVEPMLDQFNVYEMKSDYSEWFVKYSVDLSSSFVAEYPEMTRSGEYLPKLHVIYVLSLIRDEEAPKLTLRIPGKAIILNLADGTWEKLCDFVHDEIGYERCCWDGVYEESFSFCGEYGLDYIQSLSSV